MINSCFCRWYSKIVRKRLRIPRIHSKAGTDRKEWRSQWRNSCWTWRESHRKRWSLCRFLVDPRWLHLSSSHWTSGSTPRAEGRNIPYSTEKHRCYFVNSYWSGCVTREAIDDYCNVADICQILQEDLQSSLYWKRNLQKGYLWSGWRLTKIQTTFRPDYAWPEVWTKIGKTAQNREKQKNQSLTMLEDWEEFTSSIQMTKRSKEILKNVKRKTGKTFGSNHAVQETTEHHESGCEAGNCIREEFQNRVQLYRGATWIHETKSGIFCPKIMKITLQVRVLLRCLIKKKIGAQVHPDATSNGNTGCKGRSGWRMGKSQEQKGGYFGSTKRQKKFTLLHWWTYVTSKMRSWSQNYSSTKAEPCSCETL